MTYNFQHNSSFHPEIPMLQQGWDSTSLGEFKLCPRKYFYTIILGYAPRGESVHLTFGLHYHSSLEAYDHAKSSGADHEEAVHAALTHAAKVTWNERLRRPWVSDDPNKNRETLIRSIVWYLDNFRDDPLRTVQLANGKPAVELSFRFETSYTSPGGLPYLLSGHLDRLVTLDGVPYILDRKTTKGALNQKYFEEYTPDNQFTLYSLAGKVVYNTDVKGTVVDAAQILVSGTRYQREFVYRTQAQLDEWYMDLGYWLEQAEGMARHAKTLFDHATDSAPRLAQAYPMNDKACRLYGGCPFRSICSKSPESRERWLKSDFVSRRWDPLVARGDV